VTTPVIEILGLEVFAYHGVHEHEQQQGQTFVIDVRLVCRSDAATRSDRLADAVDYGAVSSRVVELATSTRHDLLERLAAAIADDLLERFAVSAVTVTVHKPWAPIPHRFRDVTVTVERLRPG
jgi:dihydroneopterin aldolase